MNTKIFNFGPGKIILAAFLFTILVPKADAQTLTLLLSAQARRVINHLVSFDSHYGTYLGPLSTALTNGTGAFNVSDTESTPVGDYYVAVANTALQDSTIAATATSLSVTGHVEISCSGSATSSQAGSGSALTSRRADGLVERLRQLNLIKPAALLAETAQRADPVQKIDDVVRLLQVLGIGLTRLAASRNVDRNSLF
jgi:hypothetical protein